MITIHIQLDVDFVAFLLVSVHDTLLSDILLQGLIISFSFIINYGRVVFMHHAGITTMAPSSNGHMNFLSLTTTLQKLIVVLPVLSLPC